MQEVDKGCLRTGRVDQTAFLANSTGLRHSEFSSFFDFNGGEYGLAILSRYPLSKVNKLRLPDGSEPRAALIAQVQHPFQNIKVANVHFCGTKNQRISQAKVLLGNLKGESPKVILGTFDFQADAKELKLFSDWTIPSKGKNRFTFPADDPKTEADFALYSRSSALQLGKIEVIDAPIASDHRPVSLELRFVK